jgi:hypothetical protein
MSRSDDMETSQVCETKDTACYQYCFIPCCRSLRNCVKLLNALNHVLECGAHTYYVFLRTCIIVDGSAVD